MSGAYNGPIVDVDLHHNWSDPSQILEYLPARWREYATANPQAVLPRGPKNPTAIKNIPDGNARRDARPASGVPAGTDFETLKEQVLDRYNIFRAVLTYNTGSHVDHSNREWAVALARAVHDWNADTWLTWDDRLYGVVAPAIGLPEEGAKEIRRAGANPRICATLLAGSRLNRPYGDPVYHPIYEATAELDMPITLHTGQFTLQQTPGGAPNTFTHAATLLTHEAMRHITSYIVHGVFEKYPNLHVIVKEWGIAWLPYLMWRLDQNYDLLKLESPWVKRWPSEYIHDHILLDTQPLDEGRTPDELRQILTSVDGLDDVLCFATDYPHIGMDDPNYVARHLPDGWARKVMCDNACRAHNWTPPPADATFAQPALATAGRD